MRPLIVDAACVVGLHPSITNTFARKCDIRIEKIIIVRSLFTVQHIIICIVAMHDLFLSLKYISYHKTA